MRERVLGRYEWGGALPAARERLDVVLSAALRARERALANEEDPRFLHPARTALILMDDAAVHDPVVLAAALMLDSHEPELAPVGALDEDAVALGRVIPTPVRSGELLLEELLAASAAVRLIACAERLDHARHAHLVPGEDLDRWIEEAYAVYVPVARRTNDLIARRYEHWAGARERRRHG